MGTEGSAPHYESASSVTRPINIYCPQHVLAAVRRSDAFTQIHLKSLETSRTDGTAML